MMGGVTQAEVVARESGKGGERGGGDIHTNRRCIRKAVAVWRVRGECVSSCSLLHVRDAGVGR